jgi:hypothetical protein
MFMKTICLATSDVNVPTNLTITGYGSTATGVSTKSSLSDWLLKGTVNKYPENDCKRVFRELGKEVISGQYCANSIDGVDACQVSEIFNSRDLR